MHKMAGEREYALAASGRLVLCGPVQDAKGSVLICPGGGYEWLSPREAGPVAQAFRAAGWNAAVLYYTVRGPGMPPLGQTPLRQAGEALALVRAAWPGPAAVCGFSAGGHLAASLGVHWQALGLPRPDALVLGYPVISAGQYAHRGSFDNLADPARQEFFSLERQVGPHTPPTFAWHTVTDPEVPVQNSMLFIDALAAAGVPCELHLYPRGVHGLSLATPAVEEPEKNRYADERIAGWFGLCCAFLQDTLKEG